MRTEAKTIAHMLDEPGAHALLEALMRHLPAGLTVAASEDAHIVRVSDYGAGLLQRTRADLENIPFTAHSDAYKVLHLDGSACSGDELPLTRACRGEVVVGEEYFVLNEDAERIPILCNAGPIRGADGKALGGVIAWMDMRPYRELLRQRDLLLAELNHRVRNHLQLLSALAKFEAAKPGTSAADLSAYLETKHAVISRVYEMLARNGAGAEIEVDDMLKATCDALSTDGVTVVHLAASQPVRLLPNEATTVGIIANELICNAIKHGYPAGRMGQVTVSCNRVGDAIELTVISDGKPLSEAPPRPGSEGRRLVDRLARQIGGVATVKNRPDEGGVLATVIFRSETSAEGATRIDAPVSSFETVASA